MKIREIEIGSGMPKICVPITENTRESILAKAEEIVLHHVDMVEWRMDFYQDVMDIEKVLETLQGLRSILGNTVLLVTFRTAAEGGQREIELTTYVELNTAVAESGHADMVDIEVFRGISVNERSSFTRQVCTADSANIDGLAAPKGRSMTVSVNENGTMEAAYQAFIREVDSHCPVVGSYHDFDKTPSDEEMERRLMFMKEAGARIPKLAVMPKDRRDVLRLLSVTERVQEQLGDTPLITMSMGSLGCLSRVSGALTGSAVTFGCLGEGSAPGQLPVEKLRTALQILQG